jgi:hypothetical protein
MGELFSSGRIVDLILCVMVLEAMMIALLPGAKLRLVDLLALLLPGAFLLLALRAALVDADWRLVALLLSVAFVSHIVDVLRRLRQS